MLCMTPRKSAGTYVSYLRDTTLEIIWCLLAFLSNAAADQARLKNPKARPNIKSFRKRLVSAGGEPERLHAIIFLKHP